MIGSGAVAIAALAAAGWGSAPSAGPADDPAVPFTVVVLPDTQHYSEFHPEIFTAQTRWIVDNKEALNIVFVLHEGDITNSNVEAQWQNANASLSLLDGVVPYLLVPGNHDTGPGGRAENRDTTLFNSTFPVSRFASRPEFVEAFDAGKLDSHAQAFRAGGTDWLVVGLEFGPRDAVLEWTRDLAVRHPGHRVMAVTHTSLYFDGTLHGSSPYHSWNPHRYPLAKAPGDVNDGVDLWEKFAKRHPNVSFVFNGHVIGDGTGRLETTGDFGNRVHHLVANYQMRANGGEGYLRILRFDASAGRVSVRTYSPWLDAYLTDPENQFTLDGLELGPPPADGRPHADAGGDRDVRDEDGDGTAVATLDGGASRDYDGAVVDWRWSERGAEIASGAIAVVSLPVGRHEIDLTVTDDDGLSMRDRVRVTVHPRTILVAERFDGPPPSGFTVADDGTEGAPSEWRPVHGRLWQTSNIFAPDALATQGRRGTRFLWTGPGSDVWDDYTLSVTVGTADDDGLGVVFRSLSGTFYKFDMDSQRAFRKLFRQIGVQEVTLAAEPVGYPRLQDLPLRIRVLRSGFDVSLDGLPLFGGTVTDGGLDAGSIGLYTWGDDGGAFDDVVVQEGCGVPWEVEEVALDDDVVRWRIAPFADEYDVVRGSLSALPSGRFGACQNARDPDLADRAFADTDHPPPGEGFTYLVRGRSLLCAGTGTYGASSSGVERRPDPGASCP